jgi:hypothetical protein
MRTITFEIKSLLKFKLDLVDFPDLNSPKKLIQKGIDILKKHSPGVLDYLSKQKIMSELKSYKIILKTDKTKNPQRIKTTFKIWVQKEIMKRLVLIIIEAIILPFTGILALLPGPNVFFYVPALLFYYHLRSYLGMRKIDVDDLNLEIQTDSRES